MPFSSFTPGAARSGYEQQVGFMRRTVNFDTGGIGSNGNIWIGTLPANGVVVSCIVKIVTAFNGATNTLTIGDAITPDTVANSTDINEAVVGTTAVSGAVGYRPSTTVDTPIFAKYVSTGTAPTTGQAIIIISFVPDLP